MMSGIRNSPPISMSSPRETTTSLPWASVSSARRTAAALLLTTSASSAPVRRRSGTATVSGRSPTSRSTWSTAGSRRRRAARSALIQRRLDLFAKARDDFLGLSSPSLGRPAGVAGLTAATYRILGEPGPQLVEVRGGQALALERAGPLDRERLDEAGARGTEPPPPAHEIGQPGRHAHSFT